MELDLDGATWLLWVVECHITDHDGCAFGKLLVLEASNDCVLLIT